MNATRKTQRVPTRFERQTRFDLEPRYETHQFGLGSDLFESLKANLLQPILEDAADPRLQRQLLVAANEAAAVAWTTPFPLLVLPALFEEKIAEAQDYTVKQERLDCATQGLVETIL